MSTRQEPHFRKSSGRRFRRLGVERVEDRCLLAATVFQTGMAAQLDGTQGAPSTASLPLYAEVTNASSMPGSNAAITFGAASPAGSTLYLLNYTNGIAQTISYVLSGASLQGGTSPSQNGNLTGTGTNSQAQTLTGLLGTWGLDTCGDTVWAVINNASTPVSNGQGTPASPAWSSRNVTQAGGGSEVLLPILVVDLPTTPQSPVSTPPAPTPPTTAPNPMPAPIDIAQVFRNPPAQLQGPMPGSESTTSPVVAGSGQSTPTTPLGVAVKPDVEGNRGKSQLFDVASSQVPQTDENPAASSDVLADGSFAGSNYGAMPTASSTRVSMGETARGDEFQSPIESNVTLIAVGCELPTTIAPLSMELKPEEGGHRGPSQATNVANSRGQIKVDDAVEQRAGGTGSAGLAASSEKAKQKSGKPFAAEKYYRADVVGLAVLAFTGQHLAQRLPRPTPSQPRPIALRRKKETAE